jgi:hypothetical protein
VRAIPHGHKRAPEWVPVNGAADLHQSPRPEKLTEPGITTYVQPPLLLLF